MKLMRNVSFVLTALALMAAVACSNPSSKSDDTDTTPPAEVTGLSAVAGDGQVVLSWTEPTDADFASVSISYQGLATAVSVDKGTDTYTFTGLTNGSSYTFDLVSVDKTGNAGASAQVSATPVAASDSEDTTPPAEVSGLSAVAGDGQVVLSWTEPTDADFLAVLINYLGIETYVTVAKGIDTYTFTGLTNGQHYTFNVISVDASGNAGAAAQASATPVATTIPSDSTPPAEVTGLSAVAGESQVSLSWTAPADSDFASVSISYTGLAAPITVAKGSSTYTFTGLTDGTAYDFTVKTVDTTGNSSTGVAASATPVDLTPPANVTAVSTVAFNGSVTLSWTEPSDADYAGVQISYAGLATPISVAKSTVRYTVTGLTNSTEYTFTVKAVDSAGNPASGVAVKATPDASKIGIVLQ